MKENTGMLVYSVLFLFWGKNCLKKIPREGHISRKLLFGKLFLLINAAFPGLMKFMKYLRFSYPFPKKKKKNHCVYEPLSKHFSLSLSLSLACACAHLKHLRGLIHHALLQFYLYFPLWTQREMELPPSFAMT